MAAALALSAGCGDDGYGRRYPVSGKVTYKGQPLKQGTITFTPADANTGRTASGHIVDGAYALTTVDNEDGALPGPYQVAIASVEVDAEQGRGTGQGQRRGPPTRPSSPRPNAPAPSPANTASPPPPD